MKILTQLKFFLIKRMDYSKVSRLARIKNDLFGYWQKSYGQTGLDLLVISALRDSGGLDNQGFYVDVGAHHPERYSNTYILYSQYSWSGINIDPIPGIMKKFDSARSRDLNLELAIVPKSQVNNLLTFYIFNDHALNTFSEELALERDQNPNFSIVERINVQTSTLENICIENQVEYIDYLNIDAEGYDFEILKTLDFAKFKPRVISIELYDFDPSEPFSTKGYSYLINKGYELYASIGSSIVFILKGLS